MRISSIAILASLFLLTACDSSPSTEKAQPEEAPATEASAPTDEDTPVQEEKAPPTLASDLEPGETRHFGAPFTIDAEPQDLQDLLVQLQDQPQATESAEPVKVSAQIHQVCQKKGCWFTLATDAVDIPVRVRMKDYGFFVSRNSDGAQAIVEGTLARTTISQEMAQHYADDLAATSGEEAPQVQGPQDSFEFTATAITITDS